MGSRRIWGPWRMSSKAPAPPPRPVCLPLWTWPRAPVRSAQPPRTPEVLWWHSHSPRRKPSLPVPPPPPPVPQPPSSQARLHPPPLPQGLQPPPGDCLGQACTNRLVPRLAAQPMTGLNCLCDLILRRRSTKNLRYPRAKGMGRPDRRKLLIRVASGDFVPGNIQLEQNAPPKPAKSKQTDSKHQTALNTQHTINNGKSATANRAMKRAMRRPTHFQRASVQQATCKQQPSQ